MAENVPKRQCFVGLFDILGFSDIVRNNKLEDVWKTYSKIKSSASFIKDNLESLFKRKIINIDNFSDTFLMYTSDYSNMGQEHIDECFNALLGVCDALFHSANTNGIPIRGAITVGELIVNDGIHLGKPIVEAYEMEHKQDWIGCWICDDAIQLISKKLLQRHMDENLILKYKIPFKGGNIMDCYVFNWVTLPFENDYDYGMLRVKSGHDWSAERKHLNTRDFIKFITSSLQNK
ncbi:MAG: hypothetical protein NTW44_01105 [Nitrospirae bacterium]|nr:hypothetical protein [Nitrospirota bacterium]